MFSNSYRILFNSLILCLLSISLLHSLFIHCCLKFLYFLSIFIINFFFLFLLFLFITFISLFFFIYFSFKFPHLFFKNSILLFLIFNFFHIIKAWITRTHWIIWFKFFIFWILWLYILIRLFFIYPWPINAFLYYTILLLLLFRINR